MKSICIFLAEGFEEMEAMFPLDILRRGGMDVKLVSVTGEKAVRSSHGVTIMPAQQPKQNTQNRFIETFEQADKELDK